MSAQGSVGFHWGTITGPYHANFSQVETQKFDPHWFYCLQWGCNNLFCQECYSIDDSLYTHFTVNHSVCFKDLETGAHTNTIENSWRPVRGNLPKSGTQKKYYESYFLQYIVRKKYFSDSGNRIQVFIHYIKCIYPLKLLPHPVIKSVTLLAPELSVHMVPPSFRQRCHRDKIWKKFTELVR